MNPWHNVRVLHAAANALFALAVLASLAAAAWWLVHRPAFELRTVLIEPRQGAELRYVSTPLLRQAVTRVSGNFFTVNLDAVRATFEAVPWVRRATARRIWPNQLQVAIEEHRPIALWGDSRLINTFGELFPANLADLEDGLPMPELFGPPGTHATVIERWDELRRWLEPVGREPRVLRLTARHAWTARLDDGTSLLLGRDQGVPIQTRVRSWVGAHLRVQSRLPSEIEIIDLRYPNGFAVRTAAAAEQEPAQSGKGVRLGETVGKADAMRVGHRP